MDVQAGMSVGDESVNTFVSRKNQGIATPLPRTRILSGNWINSVPSRFWTDEKGGLYTWPSIYTDCFIPAPEAEVASKCQINRGLRTSLSAKIQTIARIRY